MSWRRWLAAFAPAAAVLVAARLVVPDGAENSADAYYHVARADAFPEVWRATAMPQMTMSLWHERFYDKELGYHLLLGVARRAATALGAAPGPPFHLEALAFSLALAALFASSTRWLGARVRATGSPLWNAGTQVSAYRWGR